MAELFQSIEVEQVKIVDESNGEVRVAYPDRNDLANLGGKMNVERRQMKQ